MAWSACRYVDGYEYGCVDWYKCECKVQMVLTPILVCLILPC